MKIQELIPYNRLNEMASVGATAAGAVATSMGGSAGFGNSVFMRRNPKPAKKKAKK